VKHNIQSNKAKNTLILKRGFASNIRKHQENQSNLRNTKGSKRYRGIGKTNQEKLDRALVEVPSIDEQRKLNLIKSLFKSWLLFQLRRRPPFGATVMSQRNPIRAG
jgi:hypothetical protein